MDKAIEAIEQAASDPTAISSSQIIPFIINMLDTNSISADIQNVFGDKIMSNRLLLVNNAGVCLEGCTIEALKESLEVNCIGPAFLSELFLNYANIDDKEFCNQISIINVSSGDGELVFLHSEIQRQINAIETYKVSARVSIYSQQHYLLQICVYICEYMTHLYTLYSLLLNTYSLILFSYCIGMDRIYHKNNSKF